ncbi:MAG: metallophosphoesterase [Clostridiales bacterium]|nr:metallophosphoesterase [Clostridiales bacterium]
MDLNVRFNDDYGADGVYTVHAPGFQSVRLYWADEQGALPEWTSFGYIPLDMVTGVGEFVFSGGRAIPMEATHICVWADKGSTEEYCEQLFPFERKRRHVLKQPLARFGILTDLHLTRKAMAVRRGLQNVTDEEANFLLGDMTNDGSEEEFRLFEGCLDEIIPNIPVYSVNGNHDLMGRAGQYEDFQKRRTAWRTEEQNICYASFRGMDIIGINAAKVWTHDIMGITKEQLSYLDLLLNQGRGRWKIILCHTPLSRNMPVRNGHLSTYLSRDAQLQTIIDAYDHVIFLSGHTHLSPNLNSGVAYFDAERCNFYINCGSIRPTELGKEAGAFSAEWKEGNTVELVIMEDVVEIRMRTVHSKKWISRGYYMDCIQ